MVHVLHDDSRLSAHALSGAEKDGSEDKRRAPWAVMQHDMQHGMLKSALGAALRVFSMGSNPMSSALRKRDNHAGLRAFSTALGPATRKEIFPSRKAAFRVVQHDVQHGMQHNKRGRRRRTRPQNCALKTRFPPIFFKIHI